MNGLYKRELYLKKIRGFYDESEIIKVITGVRRCGKSSLLQTIIEELKEHISTMEDAIMKKSIASENSNQELKDLEARVADIQEQIKKTVQ